jgi:hypothetical protein
MLDKDFNVFLIEINTNPGIEISSPWIQIIIPRMLDDALRLTVDKVFEPVYDFSKNYKGDYTEEQKKLLMNSKIPYDFNGVNPNPESYRKSTSIQSSTLSNSNLTENKNGKSNSISSNILNINLELDEFDQNLIKGQIVDKNKSDKKDEEKDEEKNEKNNAEAIDNKNIENKNIENKKIINNEEKKGNKCFKSPISNKKNKIKYISPFPVPGYSLDENLWDFVCDLNQKDPYEIEKEKEKDKEKEKEKGNKDSFTGIRHLLKKRKKKNKKEKNEENK